MTRARSKPIYALVAGAALAMVVMPIAFAGAADNPQSTASASVKKQVKKLKKRIAALEQAQGGQGPGPASLPPNGPAGGDLTGNYPNPLVGPAAVGTDALADDSVVNAKIANAAVGTNELADDAVLGSKLGNDVVNSPKIADASIQSSDIGGNSVGSDELKGVYENATGFVAISAGTSTRIDSLCDAGDRSIGWGATWDTTDADVAVSEAFRLSGTPNGYTVRGNNTDGATHSIAVRVLCLDA